MTGLDWSVFALYFGGVLAFAWYQSRKNVGVEGFFLANRRLHWGVIGLSVMATQASAITYIGTTGQAFESGMEWVQVYLPQPLAMVMLCVIFVPFFYRAKVYTAYEYLERRFDAKTRSLTSFLFLLQRALGAGFALYAPSIVLSVIMGWDERITILIMAVVTIGYTLMGGITAVIWTDVIQMVMMFVGIGVALVLLFTTLPEGVGVGETVYLGGIQEMWTSIDLSWDPTNDYTIWSGMIGGFFLALAYFGADQSQVQRYLTAKSLTQSRLSLIFNAFLKIPMQVAILAIGVLLFVFYHFERPPLIFNSAEVAQVENSARGPEYRTLDMAFEETHAERRAVVLDLLAARERGDDVEPFRRDIARLDETLGGLRESAKGIVSDVRGAASNDVNYVFPSYLIDFVPAGLLGILIAVIFAAAMSSLDSELTALSSATVIDFYRRWARPDETDAHYLRVSRWTTLFWGTLSALVALYAGQLGSLVEAVNQVGSLFYGSILGVFLLAFLVKRATGTAAFVSVLVATGVVALVAIFTEISWLYYNVIGATSVLVVGRVLSGRATSASLS